MQQVVANAIDDDGGKPKGLPLRTCIATRETKPVADLIRFVASPAGALVPDLKASLPGRGVWVSADRANLLKAIKMKAFQASLKSDVAVDPALPDHVAALLRARALAALSLANKAGDVVCGATKIEKAIGPSVLALLHASEGGRDGIEKLDRICRAATGGKAPSLALFAGTDLDMALGRSNVIHAALMDGQAGQACFNLLRRITIYES